MKKTTLFSGLLMGIFACSPGAHAQQGFPFMQKRTTTLKSQAVAQQLLKAQAAGYLQNKPTAAAERVIAQSFYDDTGAMGDSTSYAYANNERGSAFNYYNFDFSYNISLVNVHPLAQENIGPNSILDYNDALADTLKNYGDDGSVNGYYVGYYRADNQLDSIIYYFQGSGQQETVRTINTFNSHDALIQSEETQSVGGIAPVRTTYAYDAGFTKLLADSTFFLTPNPELREMMRYTYNAQGKIDSVLHYIMKAGNNLEVSDLATLSYNANGQVSEMNVYRSFNPSNTPLLSSVERYTYYTTEKVYKTWEQLEYDNGVLEDSTFVQINLGNNGLPDTLKGVMTDISGGGTPENIFLTFSYNTANSPVSAKMYDGTGALSGATYFYYETYEKEDEPGDTAVNNTIVDSRVEIYPNPFGQEINLIVKNSEAAVYNISLTDAFGRKVMQQQDYLLKGGYRVIQVPQTLPSGLYILTITNTETGQQLSRKMMKR